MKHWPAPPPRTAPLVRRRIPMFHPVPVAPRRDGWTVQRQAWFIGVLAETRSVVETCRRVGMGRESAYRLRKRPGAAGFAAAWDAALGRPHIAVDPSSAKATGLPAAYRFHAGLVQVHMHAGKLVAIARKPDNSALLQHLAQLGRAAGDMADPCAKSHDSNPGYAFHEGEDRADGAAPGAASPCPAPRKVRQSPHPPAPSEGDRR
ncbi:hypothetical protein [Tsuneonella mangrovi]|uniref:hypothetical protein n=1 Tax=Tsuneonella mangrovi TaxID=1982042 RepID=UPI000BA26E63|nr:hypothetical protein [Tsuneonella mangrovi]